MRRNLSKNTNIYKYIYFCQLPCNWFLNCFLVKSRRRNHLLCVYKYYREESILSKWVFRINRIREELSTIQGSFTGGLSRVVLGVREEAIVRELAELLVWVVGLTDAATDGLRDELLVGALDPFLAVGNIWQSSSTESEGNVRGDLLAHVGCSSGCVNRWVSSGGVDAGLEVGREPFAIGRLAGENGGGGAGLDLG